MKESIFIIEYTKKRDKFIIDIQDKFDTFYDQKHDDLKSIIDWINYTDKLVHFLANMSEANKAINYHIEEKERVALRIINTHTIDSAFNKEKADRWLGKAIQLFIDGYSFDGIFFRKGEEKKLKGTITK